MCVLIDSFGQIDKIEKMGPFLVNDEKMVEVMKKNLKR
jgi:hypothetical protein